MTTTLVPPNHELWQAVLRADGTAALDGKWNPRALAAMVRPADVAGKRVLDLGANTGGFSLELARMGASVVAVEPVVQLDAAASIAAEEGLSLRPVVAGLFDAHTLGDFDVVFCFGLLYHFRNPHYVLDYLSSLAAPLLYLSTQTAPGAAHTLRNRAAQGKPLNRGTRGWEPTHAMLRMMLEASGFDEIELLTDREYNRPEMPAGLTNSAYYRARCAHPVRDPEALNRTYEARWRKG